MGRPNPITRAEHGSSGNLELIGANDCSEVANLLDH
jgi:hypothetical protein